VVGQKPGVEVEEHVVNSLADAGKVPPISVSIYEFPVR
jgi:hypothetical protein